MNSWNERFATDQYVYGKEPNAFVVEAMKQLQLPTQGNVLCIAEGEGRNAVYIATLGYDVTAWDYAQAGLDKTQRLAAEKGVTVETALHDLTDVKWQEQEWDMIVHIFGHVPKTLMERTWQGIQQSLKPGGYYVSELYTKEQLQYGTGGPKNEELLVDPLIFYRTFQSFFPKHFYVGEVERHEGILHTGRAHVVQSIFQKKS